MIELSGLKPDEDIQIEFIGIRPGEKLFEELSHRGENFVPTSHAKICRFISQPAELGDIRRALQHLRANLHEIGASDLKILLKQAVPDYAPYSTAEEQGTRAITDLTQYRLRAEAKLLR